MAPCEATLRRAYEILEEAAGEACARGDGAARLFLRWAVQLVAMTRAGRADLAYVERHYRARRAVYDRERA